MVSKSVGLIKRVQDKPTYLSSSDFIMTLLVDFVKKVHICNRIAPAVVQNSDEWIPSYQQQKQTTCINHKEFTWIDDWYIYIETQHHHVSITMIETRPLHCMYMPKRDTMKTERTAKQGPWVMMWGSTWGSRMLVFNGRIPLPRQCTGDGFHSSFSCKAAMPWAACFPLESLFHCNWVKTALC